MPGSKEIKDVDVEIGKESAADAELTKCRFIDRLLYMSLNDDSGGRSRFKTFEQMDICQRMYDGDHWRGINIPKHRAKSVTNHCFAVVEGALPIICDQRPKTSLAPGADGDYQVVDQLSKVYDAKYDALKIRMKTELAVKSHLVKGEGYWKVFWNPLLIGGLGDVDIQLVSPYRMSFIGGNDPLLSDAYAVIYNGRHTIGEIQGWYPQYANRIRDEYVINSSAGEGLTGEEGETVGYGRVVSDDGAGAYTTLMKAGGGSVSDGTESLIYTEVWLDDKTLYESVEDYLVIETEAGFENAGVASEENKQRLLGAGINFEVVGGKALEVLGLENQVRWLRKYPYGRIMAKVGNFLLCDKPSPYKHGRCPYVRFFGCPVPGKNYFYGEIDQIITLQKELNKRKSQIIDIMNLTSNPPMLVNIMAGIKTSKMTNQPGLIIPVSMDVDRAAKWLQVPNIPSHLFVSIQQTQEDISSVTGFHDITQGRKPAGITAGVAIESLQEAAQIRYRQKARYLEDSLCLATELMISIIWQFYREPRIIRSKDKQDPGKYVFETVDFSEATLNGGLPDVSIKSGSTMPVNEAVRRQQAMELMQIVAAMDPRAGLAFLPKLLEKWDWPNIDETMKLINDALAGGQQMPGQPPPQMV